MLDGVLEDHGQGVRFSLGNGGHVLRRVSLSGGDEFANRVESDYSESEDPGGVMLIIYLRGVNEPRKLLFADAVAQLAKPHHGLACHTLSAGWKSPERPDAASGPQFPGAGFHAELGRDGSRVRVASRGVTEIAKDFAVLILSAHLSRYTAANVVCLRSREAA